MSKKLRYLLFVLVLMVPLVLAACGGDDDDDNGGDSVSLNQTFESETGVSFKYPEGWVAKDDAGQIMLANSQEALDALEAADPDTGPEKGQAAIVMMVMPLAEMGMPEDTEIGTLFDMMVSGMTGEGMTTVGDTEELTINDNDARRINVSDEKTNSDGFVIAYMDGSDAFVMLIGLTASGERGDYDGVALDIAETIEYSAPAAE